MPWFTNDNKGDGAGFNENTQHEERKDMQEERRDCGAPFWVGESAQLDNIKCSCTPLPWLATTKMHSRRSI
jgi:hypothetical protein